MDAACIVGIDVAKNKLDIHIHPQRQALLLPRTQEGIAELIRLLQPLAPQRLGIEATGGFETVVAATLAAANLPVIVLNPARIHAFRNALASWRSAMAARPARCCTPATGGRNPIPTT
jgi:transposase